jgi:hypothetical protein
LDRLDLDIDENIKKLFCGRTGHLCIHKKPSTLHRQSITGPSRSIHALSALNIDTSSSRLDETPPMEEKDNAAVLTIG